MLNKIFKYTATILLVILTAIGGAFAATEDACRRRGLEEAGYFEHVQNSEWEGHSITSCPAQYAVATQAEAKPSAVQT